MKDFIELPFQIYKSDDYWVPPLRSEVRRTLNTRLNPYFKNCELRMFSCYKNSKIVSRIALMVNLTYNSNSKLKIAQFGFFETYNDSEAVRLLLIKVGEVCKGLKIELLEGPFNPNHYSELGMQSNQFGTSQSFFQTFNPEYYNELLTANGFVVSKILHTRGNNFIKDYLLKRYGENVEDVNYNGYSVRQFDLRNLKRDLENLREIYNDAFSSNWHFIPVSREEYLFTAKYLKWVAKPELIRFVEFEGKPVGVVQCIEDINPRLKKLNGRIGPVKFYNFIKARKNIRTLIIYAVGIKKSFQHSQVYYLLLNEMIKIAKEYDVLETTWLSKENLLAVRAAERLGLQPDKEFVIYEKRLE